MMEFGHKLCGYENILAVQPFDNVYRRRRKLVHQQLGTKTAVISYQAVQEAESCKNALRILDRPAELADHMKTFAAAVVLKIAYGYSVEPTEADPLVSLIERMLMNVTSAFVPMAWIVDVFPAFKYLPVGWPGASFKTTAKLWKSTCEAAAQVPYSFTVQQMDTYANQPSYVSRALEYHADVLTKETEGDIKWTAATLYAAGTETTSATLTSFILAMIMFPNVQQKAQEEIDRVIGRGRLPSFKDQENLPYINRIVTESYRWFPNLPMGIAHQSDEDLVFAGFDIPKGTCIFPAIWGICHDPQLYPNPSDFDPDRYLDARNEPDPREVVFGFGRRICPGRFLAEASIFISIAHILAAFKIGKATDQYGADIEVKLAARAADLASQTNHVDTFAYSIVPRTEAHAKLIREVGAEQSWDGDSSLLGQM
ncbi:hypothetical protein NLG97_g4262 [Lecanicillium saksenae]|uniref:Uncharacterized protein n=1 Tax=Lecanicillium saksenae TaxID=468837 RepID=A0ACC1QVU1_9HYPO|nr:hypothetical protein NLG97_g4262 [Lecanicillium saksenae]